MGRHTNAKRAELAAQAAAAAMAQESSSRTEPEPEQSKSVPAERPKADSTRPAYDEVVARHEAELAKGDPKIEPEPKAEAKPEPATEPEAVKEATKAEPAAEVETVVETVEPAKVKIKVDGEEIEVTQAEVDDAGGVRALQRELASERRLQKANEIVAETRRTQAAIAEYVQQQQSKKEPEVTVDQFIQSKVNTIRFGTEEESASALKEIFERASQKVDPQAITRQVLGEVKRNQAIDGFAKEFQDIAANPLLLRLAMSLEAERTAKGPVEDWPRFYRTIGNEVRGVARPHQPPASESKTADTTSTGSDKEARKASIVNLPTAAARAELPKESKPETREDILNEMKAARGLPTG